MSRDGGGVERLHQVGHPPAARLVADGVVPGVGHAYAVDAEHARGLSIQLACSRLNVVFRVVLTYTHTHTHTHTHVHRNIHMIFSYMCLRD